MAKDKKIEALKGVRLFAGCSDRELKSVARATDRIELAPGATLMEEGAPGHDLWIIAEGTARVSRGGRKLRVAGPGEALGELSLLDGEVRSATVTAETALTAYVIDGRSFSAMVKDVPVLGLKIMQGMAARLRAAEGSRTR